MLNCRVIFINAPVDAGASAVAKRLSEQLPESVFLDGDKIVSQEGLEPSKWIIATVMTGTLRACELAHEGKLPIVAFPVRDGDWKVITGICAHAGVTPICVTLGADTEVAFSSLTLENPKENPQTTCDQILSYLRTYEMH